jgi:hypothetical protein
MDAAPHDGGLAQLVQLTRQQDQSSQQRDECQHDRQRQTQEYASSHDSFPLSFIAQRYAGARAYSAIGLLKRN